jgi:hypothetical protein
VQIAGALSGANAADLRVTFVTARKITEKSSAPHRTIRLLSGNAAWR